jgi:hypothetical protein
MSPGNISQVLKCRNAVKLKRAGTVPASKIGGSLETAAEHGEEIGPSEGDPELPWEADQPCGSTRKSLARSFEESPAQSLAHSETGGLKTLNLLAQGWQGAAQASGEQEAEGADWCTTEPVLRAHFPRQGEHLGLAGI